MTGTLNDWAPSQEFWQEGRMGAGMQLRYQLLPPDRRREINFTSFLKTSVLFPWTFRDFCSAPWKGATAPSLHCLSAQHREQQQRESAFWPQFLTRFLIINTRMYIFKVLLSATSFFQTFILRCVVYLFTGAVLLLWLMCLCLIFIILKTFIQSNAGLVGRLSAQKNKPAFPPCYPREVGGPKLLLPWELSLRPMLWG